jgi:phage terminase small subunit
MSNPSLTPKQQRFTKEYLVDLNATRAAIRAGYSAKTAYSAGQRLLKHVDVARGIAEAQQKHAEKYEITLDLLTEMTLEAYWVAMADGSARGADAAVKAVAQLSKMHGFDVGKRLNDRGPIEDLTAEERDAVRAMVEAALAKAQADASVGQDVGSEAGDAGKV